MTSLGMTPAPKDFSLELSLDFGYQIWLLYHPFTKTSDCIFAGFDLYFGFGARLV